MNPYKLNLGQSFDIEWQSTLFSRDFDFSLKLKINKYTQTKKICFVDLLLLIIWTIYVLTLTVPTNIVWVLAMLF